MYYFIALGNLHGGAGHSGSCSKGSTFITRVRKSPLLRVWKAFSYEIALEFFIEQSVSDAI